MGRKRKLQQIAYGELFLLSKEVMKNHLDAMRNIPKRLKDEPDEDYHRRCRKQSWGYLPTTDADFVRRCMKDLHALVKEEKLLGTLGEAFGDVSDDGLESAVLKMSDLKEKVG